MLPSLFGGPFFAKRKGSATKFEGKSVTEAHVNTGLATGHAAASSTSVRG